MRWAALLIGIVCFFISRSRIKEHEQKRKIEEEDAQERFLEKAIADLQLGGVEKHGKKDSG